MKNLAIIALSAKFQSDAELIYTICQATQQPETAMEILLGVYQAPEIRPFGINKDGILCMILNFNPLKATSWQVEYKSEGVVTRYFRDAEHANNSSKHSTSGNSLQTTNYPYEHTYELRSVDTTSLSTWNEYCDKWDKDAIARMDAEMAASKRVTQLQAEEFDAMYPQHEGNNDEL